MTRISRIVAEKSSAFMRCNDTGRQARRAAAVAAPARDRDRDGIIVHCHSRSERPRSSRLAIGRALSPSLPQSRPLVALIAAAVAQARDDAARGAGARPSPTPTSASPCPIPTGISEDIEESRDRRVDQGAGRFHARDARSHSRTRGAAEANRRARRRRPRARVGRPGEQRPATTI